MKKKSGFTLIELMVVVAIMAILVTAGAVIYSRILANSRDARRKSDVESAKSALVLYRTDNGSYPSSLDWNTMSPVNNYISVTSMRDPRGNAYTYTPGGCVSTACKTFSVCTTLENTTPASYCVYNP